MIHLSSFQLSLSLSPCTAPTDNPCSRVFVYASSSWESGDLDERCASNYKWFVWHSGRSSWLTAVRGALLRGSISRSDKTSETFQCECKCSTSSRNLDETVRLDTVDVDIIEARIKDCSIITRSKHQVHRTVTRWSFLSSWLTSVASALLTWKPETDARQTYFPACSSLMLRIMRVDCFSRTCGLPSRIQMMSGFGLLSTSQLRVTSVPVDKWRRLVSVSDV